MTQGSLFDANTKSQEAAILRHLQSGQSITPLVALDLYKCMRLGARIWSLKKTYPIKKEMITVASGKRVASYSLESNHG